MTRPSILAPVEIAGSGVPRRARRIARRLALDTDRRWALALIAAGVLIRLGLLLLDWPPTDSDEGIMGLMALHIASRGEHPLFFYGQTYMGTLQAYLGAALFALFGSSVFSLRLGLLLLDSLFLATLYVLLRLLYHPKFALFSLVLLDLGGPELLRPQLLALGGYPETLLFGALSLLLATRLALRSGSNAGGRPHWYRWAAYGGFGTILGLGWWSDPLVLPFLVAAMLLLVVFCYHDLSRGGLAAIAVGLGIVLLPQIVYLFTGAGGPSAVAAFQPQGVRTLTQLPARGGAQMAGTLLISLPDITGANWLCYMPGERAGVLAVGSGAGALACTGIRIGWSLGVLALAAIASGTTVRALLMSARVSQARGWSQAERRTATMHFGRLMLLVGAWLTLAMYMVSPSALNPGNARYLIGVNIALPAIVYPLWRASSAAGLRASTTHRLWMASALWCRACLGLIVLVLAGGTASAYVAAPAQRTYAIADQVLVRDLARLGVHHMHTDYWTCYKIAFLTQERITCDVLSTTLGQGNNRYPPYVAAVAADPRVAYVFPADSAQAAALARKADISAWPFVRLRLDGYVVYLPE